MSSKRSHGKQLIKQMMERKQLKTKPCMAYQRGRCWHQNCSFAHGAVELRHSSASFNAKREYQSGDLRDKLDRKHSAHRRYSPERDTRGQWMTRGYSRSKSSSKSDRKRKREHPLNAHSDFSGSLRNSGGIEGQARDGEHAASNRKTDSDEQLKLLNSDINILEERKSCLEVNLEEKVQEVESLISRVKELESQLKKEEEDQKRITSKIKKFVNAHRHCSQLQSELSWSQARLQKLGDQLDADTVRIGADGEDLDINILSDGETTRNLVINQQNELDNGASLGKKNGSLRAPQHSIKTMSFEHHPCQNSNLYQSNNCKEVEAINNDVSRASTKKDKRNRRKTAPTCNFLTGKVQESEMPATTMAANAFHKEVEIVLPDRGDEVQTAPAEIERGDMHETRVSPSMLPPLPAISQNNYSKYEGSDGKNVNIDDEETALVDIV